METNNKDNINLLAENVDHSSREEGLQNGLIEHSARSPSTLESLSPTGSKETEEQGRTGHNMMAATTQQEEGTSSLTTLDSNPEQMRQIIIALSGV